jgi:hypothetical protein
VAQSESASEACARNGRFKWLSTAPQHNQSSGAAQHQRSSQATGRDGGSSTACRGHWGAPCEVKDHHIGATHPNCRCRSAIKSVTERENRCKLLYAQAHVARARHEATMTVSVGACARSGSWSQIQETHPISWHRCALYQKLVLALRGCSRCEIFALLHEDPDLHRGGLGMASWCHHILQSQALLPSTSNCECVIQADMHRLYSILLDTTG